jgi:hypothetical protein
MDAYEMVLDFATQKQPMAEAWIRELHAEICKAQKTYSALTEVGWRELELPKGQYKVSPNHVQGRDGEIHAYSPVDRTPSEMQKLIQELRTEEFATAHPILHGSYAHYAFVTIHPFADGNGRVARALASVYTYRAQSIPLLILSENRNTYIDSLDEADNGDSQPFVSFTFERTLDAIRLTEMSLRAAAAPQLEDALDSYRKVYITKGGYKHEEVDAAGYALIDLIFAELKAQSKAIMSGGDITVDVNRENRNDYSLSYSNTTRVPVQESGRRLAIEVTATEPRHPTVKIHYHLEVPKDCDLEDEIYLSTSDLTLPFSARITELVPAVSAALQIRISVFVRTLFGIAINQLARNARRKLHQQGFITE